MFYELCLRFNWYRFTKHLHKNDTKPQLENRAVINELLYVARAMKILESFRKKDGKFDGHAWITFNNKFVTGLVKDISEFEILK